MAHSAWIDVEVGESNELAYALQSVLDMISDRLELSDFSVRRLRDYDSDVTFAVRISGGNLVDGVNIIEHWDDGLLEIGDVVQAVEEFFAQIGCKAYREGDEENMALEVVIPTVLDLYKLSNKPEALKDYDNKDEILRKVRKMSENKLSFKTYLTEFKRYGSATIEEMEDYTRALSNDWQDKMRRPTDSEYNATSEYLASRNIKIDSIGVEKVSGTVFWGGEDQLGRRREGKYEIGSEQRFPKGLIDEGGDNKLFFKLNSSLAKSIVNNMWEMGKLTSLEWHGDTAAADRAEVQMLRNELIRGGAIDDIAMIDEDALLPRRTDHAFKIGDMVCSGQRCGKISSIHGKSLIVTINGTSTTFDRDLTSFYDPKLDKRASLSTRSKQWLLGEEGDEDK